LRSVKKPFSGEPKKTEKTPSRLAALKGFSVASGIFSFRLSAGVFRFLSSLKKKGTKKAFRAQRRRLSVPFSKKGKRKVHYRRNEQI
jgi:hypothetical protein